MREESRPVAYLLDTLPEDVLKPEQLPSDFDGSVLDFLLKRGDFPHCLEGCYFCHRRTG